MPYSPGKHDPQTAAPLGGVQAAPPPPHSLAELLSVPPGPNPAPHPRHCKTNIPLELWEHKERSSPGRGDDKHRRLSAARETERPKEKLT